MSTENKSGADNAELKKIRKFKSKAHNLLNEILSYCHPASSYTGNIYRSVKQFLKDNYQQAKIKKQ